MNRYEPATPRAALGVAAFALTIANFVLLVGGPALVGQREGGGVVAREVTAPVATDSIRNLPPVDVVARRDGKSETARVGVVDIPRNPKS